MPNVIAKQSTTQLTDELYWKYPQERAVGYFHYSTPTLLIRDPEIAKCICVTSFRNFYIRGYLDGQDNDKLETLMKNLFFAEGDLWRLLKKSVSPTLSTSKIKAMFPLVLARAERLLERTAEASSTARPVDAYNLIVRYTTDFISAVAFGLDSDSQRKENSAFLKFSTKLFRVGTRETIVSFLKAFFPVTFKNVKYTERIEKEVLDLIDDILTHRNNKPSNRHDFVDLMLEIKAKGGIECESFEKTKLDGSPERVSLEFDKDLIAAQMLVFFAAGYETSTHTISYTLHELAYNPEEQKKIQANIDQTLAAHSYKFTYESIKEMHYLEWAMKESMRISPAVGFLLRKCRRKCLIPDLGVTVDEGIRVMIPVSALHRDPKYWDCPGEFRPQRFSPEINEPKIKSAYIPFGIGPRSCTGKFVCIHCF